MKAYRVYFDRDTSISSYAYVYAENMTEAKRKAQEYKRAWKIPGKLRLVAEVPTIMAFGRYEGISISMRTGDRNMFKEFKPDATVQDVFDYIQELIAIQDGYVDKEAIGW